MKVSGGIVTVWCVTGSDWETDARDITCSPYLQAIISHVNNIVKVKVKIPPIMGI